MIGRSIARVLDAEYERVDEEVVRAFARRAPFRDAELKVGGEGLVAGAWKISGFPRSTRPTAGSLDIAGSPSANWRRPRVRTESAQDMLADPDSLRELVHEIKTPLNAIIGFAEIIQGQYLGPADHRYRERAGEIVAQAHLLLGAIDDLDFAAKVHSRGGGSASVDLGVSLGRDGETLVEAAAARGVELELASLGRRLPRRPRAGDRRPPDRALRDGVIEKASAGEHLRISVEQGGTMPPFDLTAGRTSQHSR